MAEHDLAEKNKYLQLEAEIVHLKSEIEQMKSEIKQLKTHQRLYKVDDDPERIARDTEILREAYGPDVDLRSISGFHVVRVSPKQSEQPPNTTAT